ncbi:MAG: (2Fe-2S)-binding protein [Terrisporobacter othiniensis]|uniref:(2Fe-2S)-binding protein n=2 Tax=Terrisporobacter TaxID=1505652 RepID=A0AAX2ZIW9_9FIRM|nr:MULTISPECIES: (2Fe-2S)-binding protein [Terrisporobacter]MDU4862855.1 (2Fe-2S)-binding protein [Terrisporobacter othiniensis]MDU6995410.1 (2Fe-2S)-binding protein [Terrisporobacter othiniensis]UEL48034.1 (2Fe-2S)-binding protein [Terrisporobacter hibernicus]SFJ27591.1 BFD-like [2Fe-2S] binding domain-containing protein [Terrisporobacter glycolicus]
MENSNKNVCNCRKVSFEKIEDSIKNGAKSFEEVIDETKATKGCGRCKSYVEDIVKSKLNR